MTILKILESFFEINLMFFGAQIFQKINPCHLQCLRFVDKVRLCGFFQKIFMEAVIFLLEIILRGG